MAFDPERRKFRRGPRNGQPANQQFRGRRVPGFGRNRDQGEHNDRISRPGERRLNREGEGEGRPRPLKGKKFIKKRNDRPRPANQQQLVNDLNKQMREYWIKSGKKGQQAVKDANLAAQKMNEEMQEYWKRMKKKQEEQKPGAEKSAPAS